MGCLEVAKLHINYNGVMLLCFVCFCELKKTMEINVMIYSSIIQKLKLIIELNESNFLILCTLLSRPLMIKIAKKTRYK